MHMKQLWDLLVIYSTYTMKNKIAKRYSLYHIIVLLVNCFFLMIYPANKIGLFACLLIGAGLSVYILHYDTKNKISAYILVFYLLLFALLFLSPSTLFRLLK